MKKSLYRKSGVSMAEIWFCNEVTEDANGVEADIALYIEARKVCKKFEEKVKRFTTSVIDLNQSEEELFMGMSKKYRNEIRRADRENITCKMIFSDELLRNGKCVEQFECVYNQMYLSKGINDRLNKRRLYSYAESGILVMTVGSIAESPVVYHTYIVDERHCRLLQSTSNFRSLKEKATQIGYANKVLHWYDIKEFKKQGILEYDGGYFESRESQRYRQLQAPTWWRDRNKVQFVCAVNN